jgi:hypothetical protein
MQELGVYVVRVYRQDASGTDGVVEWVSTGEQLPFHDRDDLWQALHDLPSLRRRQAPHINPEEES